MKERISGALAQIQRGIECASKSVCDSSKDAMRYLRLAVEAIRNRWPSWKMNAMTAATRTGKEEMGSKRIGESTARDQSGSWIGMPMSGLMSSLGREMKERG
jgi:hypothetical protein